MQRPAPPPAVVAPLRPVLPAEDPNFAELVAGSCVNAAAANERVEARIHTRLSSLHLRAPVQFGLFAKCAIAEGEEVTPYGGILRSASDARKLPAHEKTHIREIGNGFVLDGLPLADMFDRPIPYTTQTLFALEAEGLDARHPTPSRFAAADLERFAASALGFMANMERCYTNVAPLASPSEDRSEASEGGFDSVSAACAHRSPRH